MNKATQNSPIAPIIQDKVVIPLEFPRESVIKVKNITNRTYIIRVCADGDVNECFIIDPKAFIVHPGETYNCKVLVPFFLKLIKHGLTRDFDISYTAVKQENINKIDIGSYWRKKKADGYIKCEVTFLETEAKEEPKEEPKKEEKKEKKEKKEDKKEEKKKEKKEKRSYRLY